LATISELVFIAAAHTGVSLSRANWTARRLIEADLLPKGVGKAVPQASNRDIATLLIAICSGASGGHVVEATIALAATKTVGGHVIPGAKPYTAHDAVVNIVAAIQDDNSPHRHEAVRSQIEVCGSWPEVRITTPNQEMIFVEHDALPSHWRSSKVRETRTLPGIAIVSIVDDLAKLHD
jgi:hypothetical protein